MSDIRSERPFNGKSTTQSKPTESSNCSREQARHYALTLVNAFRKDDASNPDIFAQSLVLVFVDYPEWIVRHVCHPKDGMPSRQNFLPTVFEVRQACEALMHAPPRPRSKPLDYVAEPWRRHLGSGGGIPQILPYMPGQPDNPRDDPRAGKTVAELRALGYRDEHIGVAREPFPWLPNLPGDTERERVAAGFKRLQAEIVKAADHMNMAKASAPPPVNWRDMRPAQAEDRLGKLAEQYAKTPLISLSEEARRPFVPPTPEDYSSADF